MKHKATKMIIIFAAAMTISGQTYAKRPRCDQDNRYGNSYGYPDQYQRRQGYEVARHGFDNPIDERQARQYRRVHRGIETGQLTRKEANRLHRKMGKIASLERKFSADGYLSPREQAVLQKKLNRTSQKIHRFKHNRRSEPYRNTSRDYDYSDRRRAYPQGAVEFGIQFFNLLGS